MMMLLSVLLLFWSVGMMLKEFPNVVVHYLVIRVKMSRTRDAVIVTPFHSLIMSCFAFQASCVSRNQFCFSEP